MRVPSRPTANSAVDISSRARESKPDQSPDVRWAHSPRSSSSPLTSFTLGSFLISTRASFHARWTTHESDRSSRAASSLISVSIDSGKYRLCLRLSVFVASVLLGASLSFMGRGSCIHPWRGTSLRKKTQEGTVFWGRYGPDREGQRRAAWFARSHAEIASAIVAGSRAEEPGAG